MASNSAIPQVDPGDTHVVAVGIGRYDIGASWDLPFAAEHALQFAEWAHFKGGVKQENIHLFLSIPEKGFPNQSEKTGFQSRLDGADLKPRRAARQGIEDFIDKELCKLSGALLYIFWSGHGSISENKERILFTEDMNENQPRHVHLNHLLLRLRCSPHGRFPLQLAYIDACANRFEELRFKISPGDNRPGIGKLIAGVRQVFFMAADSGQQADAGEFSKALIQSLREHHAREHTWPPDPDVVREDVRPQFQRAGQHPVQIAWSTREGDEDGEEIAGDLPASDYVNAAALVARYPVRFLRRLTSMAPAFRVEGSDARRDALYQRISSRAAEPGRATRLSPDLDLLRLIATALESNRSDVLRNEIDDIAFSAEMNRLELLRDARLEILALQTTVEELRRDYLATVKPLGPAPARLNAATLDALLDELTQIRSDDRFRFLWEFLLRVAAHQGESGEGIATFVRERTDPLLIETIRQDLRREHRFLLSVMIDPDDDRPYMPMRVEAKLLFADTLLVVETFAPQDVQTWDDVEKAAGKVVRNARETVMKQYRRSEDSLDIEFLMPDGTFCRAPDQFGLGLRLNPATMGRVHSVIIRWRERVVTPWDVLTDPWYSAGVRIDRKALARVHWIGQAECEAGICESWQGLVALKFLPDTEMNILIGAGLPFIAWLRAQPVMGWDTFQAQFDIWASRHQFEALPRELRTIRQNPADLGISLTMFWDDPNYSRHWMPLQEPTHD